MPAPLAEICDRLGMPEREARRWLERFDLRPIECPDGVARHPDLHATLLAIVQAVLECPYASSALAVHAVEAALAPEYPAAHWPRELDRLKVRLLALIDEARDQRAAVSPRPSRPPALAASPFAWLRAWFRRRIRRRGPDAISGG